MNNVEGKCVIVSAPSGSGKTTIVHHLLKMIPELEFSVSACSRERRNTEIHEKDYYFLSTEEFKRKIGEDAFIEWEEVYQGHYYGTLRTEIARIWKKDKTVIFDVDVKGAGNLKKIFSDNSLALFVMPPSIDELKARLLKRGDSANLEQRLQKAAEEIKQASMFDAVVINEDIIHAQADAEQLVRQFLKS